MIIANILLQLWTKNLVLLTTIWLSYSSWTYDSSPSTNPYSRTIIDTFFQCVKFAVGKGSIFCHIWVEFWDVEMNKIQCRYNIRIWNVSKSYGRSACMKYLVFVNLRIQFQNEKLSISPWRHEINVCKIFAQLTFLRPQHVFQ